MQPTVKLVSITPEIEKTIAYIARVSNPANQSNPDPVGLIKYCLKHGHWSVFEQGFLTIEVNLPVAISVQILRHRSFCFQQFSQRYADVTTLDSTIPLFELRTQDSKNRQSSHDNLDEDIKKIFLDKIEKHFIATMKLYNEMLAAGIAKECARFILPGATPTRIYISGTVRSWIHYLQTRDADGVQKEHRDVARLCKVIFVEQLPTIGTALSWI